MRKPEMALIYDFDGTLVPGNMQEHKFIPEIQSKPKKFWKDVKELAKKQDADEILAYMHHMLKKAQQNEVRIQKSAFREYGKGMTFFPGVEEWFDRINAYGQSQNVNVKHYIISSGIQEMIEGTSIGNKFERIYASSFMYDQHEVAIGPALSINYTTKTQFIFRINKGVPEIYDNSKINEFQPKEERKVPFDRMVFLGDGDTDVPCMKLVKDQGGYSIAVYKPRTTKKSKAQKLINENRVDFASPADYSSGNRLDNIIKTLIDKVSNGWEIEKFKKKI